MLNSFETARESVAATPSLVVDLATVDRNIRRLMNYAQQHGISVRPHAKTHKSRFMARRQLAAGACGLTVAKLGEAEVFAPECSDILIAYPLVDPVRLRKLRNLACSVKIRVVVDSEEGVDAVGMLARSGVSALGVLIDVDLGVHRTGVASPEESLQLARRVLAYSPDLRLDGILFYPGQIWSNGDEQTAHLRIVDSLLGEHLNLWKRSGIEATIVSGGSTPTQFQSHVVAHQTEIRPGTSVYNDMNTVRGGFCEMSDCAAAIICTVVSRAVSRKAVVDGGSKTFTLDSNIPSPTSGFGYVLEYPEAKVVRLSEEHGELDLAACPKVPRVGERITVIPNHICPCVNLHETFHLQQADGALNVLPVDARGKLV